MPKFSPCSKMFAMMISCTQEEAHDLDDKDDVLAPLPAIDPQEFDEHYFCLCACHDEGMANLGCVLQCLQLTSAPFESQHNAC